MTVYDLAPYLAPNSVQGYMLNSGELCQSVRGNAGYTRFLKNAHYETLWFDDQSIYRGLDTSNLPNEVYAQFTGDRYGAVWCKRFMNVGDVTERNPDIRYYDANGKFLRSAPGGVSYLRFAQHYPSYTYTQTGKTVSDVIELTWELDREGKQVVEYYHYAKGMGLVAFEYTGTPRFASQFSGLTPAKPTFTPLPNFAEPVPPPVVLAPPVPVYPVGTNPQQMKVNQPAGVTLRSSPSTSGAKIAVIPKDTQALVFEQPVISADGYFWQRVTVQGTPGWCANYIDGRPSFVPVGTTPVPTPTFRIISPLPSGVVTARFNEPRDYGKHEGMDWALAPNPCAIGVVKAVASADGVVDSVRDFPTAKSLNKLLTGYGLYVRIKHVVGVDTYFTWYGHLSAALVCVGQTVKQSDPVGILGTSGNSTGYHVHLTVQHIGKGLSGYVIEDVVDPAPLLS